MDCEELLDIQADFLMEPLFTCVLVTIMRDVLFFFEIKKMKATLMKEAIIIKEAQHFDGTQAGSRDVQELWIGEWNTTDI